MHRVHESTLPDAQRRTAVHAWPFALALLLLPASAAHAAGWEIVRDAVAFDRCELTPVLVPTEPGIRERIRSVGLVSGYAEGQPWNPIAGWLEYDVQVPATGWCELIVPGELWTMEYLVDGALVPNCTTGGKIGNLWLTAGKHVLRLQRWNVGGFQPALRGWTLRASGPSPAQRLSWSLADGRSIVRVGEAVKLSVRGGGGGIAARATARLVDTASKELVASRAIEFPAGGDPTAVAVELPCARQGVYELSLADGDQPFADLRPAQVIAVDTAPSARGGELRTTALSEVDCVAVEPAYAGQGGSRVVDGPAGRYRESGDVGFLYAQHHGEDAGWFAYAFTVPEAGRPYLLEADCPDDAFRTFAIAIRDAKPDAYPVAGGLDTGGCYQVSNGLQRQSLLFWPRSTDLRALFMTAHRGRAGAACARFRVSRVDGEIPLLDVPRGRGRTFANWYEEGDNFLAMYGGDRGDAAGILRDADRWARSAASMGVDTLIDTVAVYQMGMYPSRYNACHVFSGTFDLVRVLTLACEKHGLGFIAEFHPECRDLDHLGDPVFTGKPRSNYLVDKDGGTRDKVDAFPRFHPLDPVDQEWYLGMVGEFVDRYRDSPALRGVSLRVMGWQNPALNNFHDLDWGYDDLTVGLFERETGLSTGAKADDPKRFQARYAWLMAHARQRWIDWRCRKIADLYVKLRDRVRAARPDLKLYTDVFDRPEMSTDAGVDPRLLGAIDGVVVVDARMPYGRQGFTYDGPMADARRRDLLLDPARLLALRAPDGDAAFMFYSCYFEGGDNVVPPESLGYPAGTRRTWISAVVNPPGRQYLERYAVALAQADVGFFADGGNAYTLGQPILREFMNEFRRLPPARFTSRADAVDPVAVRELAGKDDLLFYAVNAERHPVRVSIALAGASAVERLATGEALPVAEGAVAFELQAYQLLAFRAPKGARIASVTTTVPPEAKAAVEAQVAAVTALERDAASGAIALAADGKELLRTAADEARRALADGRLRRARTVLENSRLAELVYAKALRFPPGLEFLADPQTAAAIRARGLPRARDARLIAPLDRVADGATPVVTAGVTARIEGACSAQDGRAPGAKALRLDGRSGRVAVSGAAFAGADRTVSLWFAADDVTGRHGLVAGGGCEIYLWNGSIVAEGGAGDARVTCRTEDGRIAPGAWHHLAVVYAGGGAITQYLDGVEVKRAPFAGALGPAAGDLVIGWNGWGGIQDDPSPGWFAGKLAQVRIFDRALTADEVLAESVARD